MSSPEPSTVTGSPETSRKAFATSTHWFGQIPPVYVALGIVCLALIPPVVVFGALRKEIRETERRLEESDRQHMSTVTAMESDLRQLQLMVARLLASYLLGNNPEEFSRLAILASSEIREWPEEKQVAFKEAVFLRWLGAVQNLANSLVNEVTIDRNKLLRIFGGERPKEILSVEEQKRMIELTTDVSFRLTYDAAYAVHASSNSENEKK